MENKKIWKDQFVYDENSDVLMIFPDGETLEFQSIDILEVERDK